MTENAPITILIVDDNPEIREILTILLSAEGYITTEAADGATALSLIHSNIYDLIILDVMMPGLDGYRTCLSIREYSNTPILFLSAKAQEHDKVLGFASGGDDYLTKPFSYSELTSRVKALVRRYHIYQGKPKISSQPICRIGALVVDEQQHTVEKNAHPISLTDLEYAILLLLIKHRGQIFSASHLYEAVWEEPYYDGANNTIMVHIRNLRRKLEDDPAHPTLIRTVWGRGYRCE